MKGKIIFFAGIFMVATGLPMTLFAMHLIGEIGNDFSRGVSTEWDVFPNESISHKYLLGSRNLMTLNATLIPQGIPVNIFINWDSRNYEILNKTIDTSQTFEIEKRVLEGEYDIAFTNKGDKPVYVEIDIYDSTSAEKFELRNFYSKIVIPFYYLFFFGGIAIIVIGAVLWRKRK